MRWPPNNNNNNLGTQAIAYKVYFNHLPREKKNIGMNTIFQIVRKLKKYNIFLCISIFSFIQLFQSVRWENKNLPSPKILSIST